MKRHPFDSAPFPPDLFVIPPEDRVTLRRSMERDVERLRGAHDRGVAGQSPKLLDEAAAVGRLLDVLNEE